MSDETREVTVTENENAIVEVEAESTIQVKIMMLGSTPSYRTVPVGTTVASLLTELGLQDSGNVNVNGAAPTDGQVLEELDSIVIVPQVKAG